MGIGWKQALIILSLLFGHLSMAQLPTASQSDSNRQLMNLAKDTANQHGIPIDSQQIKLGAYSKYLTFPNHYRAYLDHPYLPMKTTAIARYLNFHEVASKDLLFYSICLLVFLLALLNLIFPKYLSQLFKVIFQSSLRQKQTRDQLLQDQLPSLITNFLFVINLGLYSSLLINEYQNTDYPFWLLALSGSLIIFLIYLGKYLVLLFAGWVFNVKEATNAYAFIVFQMNKLLGVLVIPFLILEAFANPSIRLIGRTLFFGILGLVFFYRFWVSFSGIQKKLKVNGLHFFIYLCAVEIIPMALIYKLLANYLSTTV